VTSPDGTVRLRFTPEYAAIHRLADGTKVRLRLMRPDDRDVLLSGFERLSPESRYLRFFTAMPRLPESTLHRLLDVDGWNHVAIGAEAATRKRPAEGFGIARFARLEGAPDVAEASVAVVDHMQRRGLGKLLLSELALAARERGITRFRAEVLRTNAGMTALLHELVHDVAPVLDGAVATYELPLPEPAPEASSSLFRFLKSAAAGLEVLWHRHDGTGG
jgi:GNAT superfamily N-acetyltransferase